MNKAFNWASIFLCAIFSMTTFAGEGTGIVEIEHVGNFGGKDVLFFYTAARTGQPTCNTYHGRWVLDISTALGKSQYSLLLAAQASGKEVRVIGQSTTCSIWADSETASIVGYPVNYANHP